MSADEQAEQGTPRTDAFESAIYNSSMAAQADVPGLSGHDYSPEEAYKEACAFARTLELELSAQRQPVYDLDSRNFYELCQQYRHARIDAAKEFEAIKAYLRDGTLPWESYDE